MALATAQTMPTARIPINNELVERYFTAALQAGCPMDQVSRFYKHGYIGQPKQLEFHAAARQADKRDGPTIIGLGGARGPGKSHACMSQIGLDDCQRVAGLKFLFLRKIQKAAQESFDDLIRRTFTGIEHHYAPSQLKLEFPNESKIITGGWKDNNQLASYLGIQYDGICVEEATLLTEEQIDMVLGSMRTSIEGWRPRLYVSSNPGGVGHHWFRERLVIPARERREKRSRFIFSTYKDNKFLNPEYIEYLEELKGPLGQAWRDGNWDIFEGMAFPLWDYETHTIKAFPIPEHWVKWRAIDWGYAAPFCCLWFTRDPDTRRIFIYREVYQAGLTVPQQARMVTDMTPPNEKISVTYADPSMWAKNTAHEIITSTADEYASNGVILTRADNDRLSRKRKIDQLMADLADGEPGFKVFEENCPNFIRTVPVLTFDKIHPEDVDTEMEDHAYDTFGYGLTNVTMEPVNNRIIRNRRSPLGNIF